MKKTARRPSSTKASTAKKRQQPKSIEDYLAGIPESSRKTFDQLRAAARSAVPPEAIETISYGIPAFRHNCIVVWYAAFANHCSLFPTASVIAAFEDDLKRFSTSKGTVHFPIDKPLPVALVKKLVKARVAQVEKKKR